MKAQSVIDVILGEAKGGNIEDMVAVASAILNRAQQAGVSPEAIVSSPSQFNAFGQPIPAENNAYRGEAEKAWAQVNASGPSHDGTYYATPAAAGNLPKGLEPVTATQGHQYYRDPQSRPIVTAQGVKPVSGVVMPRIAPVPTARPATPDATTLAMNGQATPSGYPAEFLQTILANGHGQEHITGMDPDFQKSLAAFIKSAPGDIAKGLGIQSGARSVERQAQLWADALAKYGSPEAARKWVAPPGHSYHNKGQAADIAYNGARIDRAPENVRQWLHANAPQHGLKFPLGNEPWHIEAANTRGGQVPVPQARPVAPSGQAPVQSVSGRVPVVGPRGSHAQIGRGMGPGGVPVQPSPRPTGGGMTQAGQGVALEPQGAPSLATAPNGRNAFGMPIQAGRPGLGPEPAVMRAAPEIAASNPEAIAYMLKRDGWNTGTGGPVQAMRQAGDILKSRINNPSTGGRGLFSILSSIFGG